MTTCLGEQAPAGDPPPLEPKTDGPIATKPVAEGEKGKKQKSSHTAATPKVVGKAIEEPAVKPWQMTRGEFHEWRVSQGFTDPAENSHLFWRKIEKALAEDKPVLPRVLREYEQVVASRKG